MTNEKMPSDSAKTTMMIPFVLFPEMTFRDPASGPPMVLFLAPAVMLTPAKPFVTAPEPVAFVPM